VSRGLIAELNFIEVALTLLAILGGVAGLFSFYATQISPSLRRPHLSILPFRPERGDCAAFPSRPETWIRLAVRNEVGREPAEGVQILMAEIEPKDVETYCGDPRLLGLTEDRALRWADRKEAAVTIEPGVARRFDLLSFQSGSPPRLAFYDPPNDQRDELIPSAYRVRLAITARNLPPVFQVVELVIDEDWQPGTTLAHERLRVSQGTTNRFAKWEA
jgi:hypothetical protein